MGGRPFPEFDPAIPADARIYDFLLGGKDNFAADREIAHRLAGRDRKIERRRSPAAENRRFMARAVRFLAEAGIRQFVDVGCGMPTDTGNVHEIVHQVAPDGRVVYVDYDPIVVTHYRALLHGLPTTQVVQSDVRDTKDILGHPALTGLIDFDRPVAVLLLAVLQLLSDDDPDTVAAAFREAMAPGSHLAISHLTCDGPPAWQVTRFAEIFRPVREPMTLRHRDRIRSFFAGLDLLDPGLVDGAQWHPAGDDVPPSDWLAVGVARKP